MTRTKVLAVARAARVRDGRAVGHERVVSFGALDPVAVEAARAKAETWLREAGKTDAGSQARFQSIWKEDRAVLDRLVDTFALGSEQAAKLLSEVRTPMTDAPV